MNRWAFQFFTPVILFFLILLDGQLSQAFSLLTHNALVPVSHLFLVFLMYSATKHRLSYFIIATVALGVVYDSYYIGVLGIASAVFPLIALFIWEIQKIVFTNRWTRLFTIIIIVFVFETAVPLIEFAAGLIQLSPIRLVTQQLAPTLALNILFAFLLQWPLEIFYGIKKRDTEYKVL